MTGEREGWEVGEAVLGQGNYTSIRRGKAMRDGDTSAEMSEGE